MDNRYYIVRADRAGIFFGQIKERLGSEVTMTDARKLWRWDGATETLQLSVDGVKKPGGCKFTIFVDEITLTGVIEVIPCTETAEAIIKGVKAWRM